MANPPPGSQPPHLPPSVVAAEQRAREFLAQEKWRKARDELKPLVKADRGRYLPLIIQANLGLARQMMAKGLVSEAQQVLSYLATIAPAGQLRAVELELAGKSGATEASLPKFVAALAESGEPLAEAEKVRLADLVVLTFQRVPAEGAAQERLAAEVLGVQDALMAVSQGQWEKVSDTLRAIPHRSALSHWAVFIKGIAAFHLGDIDKAERCFRNLPLHSVPAKASQAYLLLAGRLAMSKDGKPAADAILDAACRIAGHSGASSLLLRADRLWKEGRFADSYRVFRDAVRQFPSHGRDWLGALSRFYFHAPHAMSDDERSDYMEFFDELISRRMLKSGAEEMLVRRMFSLLDCAVLPAWELRHDWESFLGQHEALHGPNPRLASLAYGWLGEQLAMTKSSFGMFAARQPQLRDAKGAVEMLQRSIELNPDNLASHLTLCAAYDALKQTSERNRLLDLMTERFPDDKKVLLHAGQGCIERKALVKGLDYFARARQLDPLDPQIPTLIAAAQRRLARQHFQQGRPEKARQILALTEELLLDKTDDFNRSRWTFLVRHGLMEQLWGDAAQGKALLTQARALAPRQDAGLLFAHLAHRLYAGVCRCDSPFLADLKQALRSTPSIGGIGLLLRVLDYWKDGPEKPRVHEEEKLVGDSVKAALRHPFTRAEAMEVIERAHGNFPVEAQVKALLKRVLRDDPLDPWFRLFQLGLSAGWEGEPVGNRNQLQAILDEAIRRHDDATVRKAREMLRNLDRPTSPLPFDPGFFADPEDDDDLDDAVGPDGPLIPDLPLNQLAEFSEILEMLRAAPDSLVRKMRKSRPPGMPEFLFDELLAIAKGGPSSPLPPRPSPPRQPAPRPDPPKPAPQPDPPKPVPRPADPNQLNLF